MNQLAPGLYLCMDTYTIMFSEENFLFCFLFFISQNMASGESLSVEKDSLRKFRYFYDSTAVDHCFSSRECLISVRSAAGTTTNYQQLWWLLVTYSQNRSLLRHLLVRWFVRNYSDRIFDLLPNTGQ